MFFIYYYYYYILFAGTSIYPRCIGVDCRLVVIDS